MKRTEKVEATLTPTEKKIFRALCDEAGCTEAELIRSVLIHREISLEDLGDDMQVSDRKRRLSIDSNLTLGKHKAHAKLMNVASYLLKKETLIFV